MYANRRRSHQARVNRHLSLTLTRKDRFILHLLPLTKFLPLLTPTPIFLKSSKRRSSYRMIVPTLMFFLSSMIATRPNTLLLTFAFY